MHRIINIVTALIISYMIQANYECLPYCYGGSLVFVPLYAILLFISLNSRIYKKEISVYMIICVVMLGYNKIAYLEANKVYEVSRLFMAIYLLTFMTIIWSLIVVKLAFEYSKALSESLRPNQTEIKQQIFSRYFLIMAASIVAVWITGHAFTLSPIYFDYLYCKMPLSLIAILILILFSLITIAVIKRIPEKYFMYAFLGHERVKVHNIRIYYVLCVILIFIIGSGMELLRGSWLLWVGTMFLFVVITESFWNTWRYVLDKTSEEIIDYETLLPLNDKGLYIKYIISFTAIGFVYIAMLVIML